MRTVLTISFLAAGVALCSMLQEPPPFTISDHVNLVLLDVSVKDHRGAYVTDLQRNNFQVLDNGKLRSITHFSSIDTPVTVGLVVDNSGSMRAKRPEIISSGLAFVKESNPQDEFFVVNFNNTVSYGLPSRMPFTDNWQLLRNALYYGEPIGQTALYDAVASALRHLELSRRDKRTLVVVSDGGDNVSVTRLSALLALVEKSRATIYSLGLYDPEDRNTHLSVLKKLSGISGGGFFQPAAVADIAPIFSRIAKDIRNCYSLGYAPDEDHPERAVHTVKVVARENGRKLVVRTRTAYSMKSSFQSTDQEGGGWSHDSSQ